jgi:hypothetical protein
MLEQSTTMVSPVVKMMREQLSRIGEYAATLYQQFDTDPEGRLVRNFGEGGKRIQAFLFPTQDTIPGNIDFDIVAMSETENPESQIKRALLVSQATQNYFATLFKVLEIFKNPQMGNDPDIRQLVMKTIKTFGTTQQKFLEAAEFDEARDAIFAIQEQGADNAQALNSLTQLLGRVAPGAGGGQPGAAGAGPAAAGGPGGTVGGGQAIGGPGSANQPQLPAMATVGGGAGGSGALGFA